MTRLSRTIFLSVALVAASAAAFAQSAEQILTKCADKMRAAPSITVKFALSSPGNAPSDCELIVSRDKYRLSSDELEIWYDGNTQWSYSPADREVSITEPTDEELLESNPFAIINSYRTQFTYRKLEGGKNEVELTSKNKMSSIRKAVITVDPKTNLPAKLIVTMSNGRTFSSTVTSAVEGKTLPSSTFIYNKEKYPAKTTIDLR